jgi:hypothetical protein
LDAVDYARSYFTPLPGSRMHCWHRHPPGNHHPQTYQTPPSLEGFSGSLTFFIRYFVDHAIVHMFVVHMFVGMACPFFQARKHAKTSGQRYGSSQSINHTMLLCLEGKIRRTSVMIIAHLKELTSPCSFRVSSTYSLYLPLYRFYVRLLNELLSLQLETKIYVEDTKNRSYLVKMDSKSEWKT